MYGCFACPCFLYIIYIYHGCAECLRRPQQAVLPLELELEMIVGVVGIESWSF